MTALNSGARVWAGLAIALQRFDVPACRFGLDGSLVDHETGEHRVLRKGLIALLSRVEVETHLLPEVVRRATRRWIAQACRAALARPDGNCGLCHGAGRHKAPSL